MTDVSIETDVLVVGAGIGGLYGVHRFREQGLSVLGIEGAGGVGGVWRHNRYPGARVDVDSTDYCYHFSSELWEKWTWSERFAAQPELEAYLNFVADTLDLRGLFRFHTWVTGAQWDPEIARYHVSTSTGSSVRCRFLVLATGQLSAARTPDFPGLERFRGEWVRTSHWPEREVALADRRIGVIGTGSSGVQAIPVLAQEARELVVFQRTPNYVVPARNRGLDAGLVRRIGADLAAEREHLTRHTPGGSTIPVATRPTGDYDAAARRALLERQWEEGGQGMVFLFTDQAVDRAANDVVAEFVREKVRLLVEDPDTARRLVPDRYPIGTRRLALDTGYYQTFARDHVTLVDVTEDPIVEFTETGIRTEQGHHGLDLVVFALGFHAFRGAVDSVGVRNEHGASPTDGWAEGPRTLLGLMTPGFPNLFTPTGVGSPSVLANLFVQNEYAMDWIGDCIAHLDARGLRTVEATPEAAAEWTAHVAEMAEPLLRRQVPNYMVQVTPGGERVFLPYVGGMARYTSAADRVAANGYEGFTLR
ncbi:NAD(P)/FAD-dependent oxidoreductase [Pseudonocardia sp. NPDC049154]|uniref:flavin-containing monooxygenase n=1 Tax=Pseudonocardia sp. NPDC049154 TaxID=3155501 RepID=UPI0033E84D64